MLWKGKWIEWPKAEREALKEKIQLHLSLNNNSRTEAAKSMGIQRRYLYKLMEKKFVEINWPKKFPPPKAQLHLPLANKSQRVAKMKATWRKEVRSSHSSAKPTSRRNEIQRI